MIIFDRWNNEESCVEWYFAMRHRSLQIFWWNMWKFVNALVQKFFFVFDPIWWMIHFRKFLLRRLIFLDIDPWKRRWIITHIRIGFPNPTILAISNEPYNCHKVTVTANSWATTFVCAVIFRDWCSSGFNLVEKYENAVMAFHYDKMIIIKAMNIALVFKIYFIPFYVRNIRRKFYENSNTFWHTKI